MCVSVASNTRLLTFPSFPMMCAFMTPVLKSDWEVHDSKIGAKGRVSKGSAAEMVSTAF